MINNIDINFENASHVPKYRQLMESIQNAIKDGILKKGDKIPSLAWLVKEYNISQDTVLMAYNELKTKGIITSSIGKGYFVANVNLEPEHKIFLFFDQLTAYKEDLYDAFKNEVSGKAVVHLFFHHNNPKVYKSLIESAIGEHTAFLIMPMAEKSMLGVLDMLPKGKTYILDLGRKQLHVKLPYVCQDFERDIYRILKENEGEIKRFSRCVLMQRGQKEHFREIATGFKDFCKYMPIESEIINDHNLLDLKSGDLCIVVDDRDLVPVVKQAEFRKLQLGSNLGLISYNEIALKEIVAGGITTISTDFVQMGKSMAQMVLTGKKEKIDNPFRMVRRNSF